MKVSCMLQFTLCRAVACVEDHRLREDEKQFVEHTFSFAIRLNRTTINKIGDGVEE